MSLSTSFPSVTGNFLNFNFKQATADLANATGKDEWDGIIKDEKIDLGNLGGPIVGTYKDLLEGNLIDNTNNKYYEYANYYKGAGDPRYPTNIALSAVFTKFMPRIEAYTELANAGGCKVINGYICNEDGIPVAQASTNCIDNINTKHITAQEIQTFIQESFETAYINESDNFIKEITNDYVKNDWTVELFDLFFVKTFILRFKKINNDNIYIKYFYDQKDYISKTLNIPIVLIDLGDELLAPTENGAAFIKVIQAGPPIYNTFNS
jgi:hypothetical protein